VLDRRSGKVLLGNWQSKRSLAAGAPDFCLTGPLPRPMAADKQAQATPFPPDTQYKFEPSSARIGLFCLNFNFEPIALLNNISSIFIVQAYIAIQVYDCGGSARYEYRRPFSNIA
jgi:hypothetical protein